jgi:hypothetical protein
MNEHTATFQNVRDWIEVNCLYRRTINKKLPSYSLKHVVERDIGLYVPEELLIDAMIRKGYDLEKSNIGTCFNMQHIILSDGLV